MVVWAIRFPSSRRGFVDYETYELRNPGDVAGYKSSIARAYSNDVVVVAAKLTIAIIQPGRDTVVGLPALR
jgi:hypothetical protein